MIIKKITIENYLCYFEVKEFELSSGLNIILGENGEGKTKFFEALDWLFNGDNRNLDKLVSAKALAQAEKNEQFRVRVSITVEQFESIKTISKSFIVKKIGENECSTTNYGIEGIEESFTGERSQVDGKALLDRIFPPEIRRYSMFKGEAELDIFKNEDALMNLINSFSDAKDYEKYSVKGLFLRDKAEKAVDEATKSKIKNQQEYKRLEAEISRLSHEREKVKVFLNTTEQQIRKTEENIQEADKYVTNAEALETINIRIRNIESQISTNQSTIKEDYTTNLFDEGWILVNFENIHHEFSKKVAALHAQKRTLQSAFDTEKGIKEGRRRVTAELLNSATPLPIGVPSKAHMQEMLKEEICKVCNRPAKEGSEAYEFMMHRLKEYLEKQQPVDNSNEDEEIILFKNDYLSKLFTMGANHEDNLANLRDTRNNIKELFEFNLERKKILEELNQKLEKELAERENIIGSSSIGAERLTSVLKNYNGWQRDLKTLNKDLNDYKHQLQILDEELSAIKGRKDSIDRETVNNFLITTRDILRDIEEIFNDTKEKKFDEFISRLETESNAIFDRINFEAFTGTITFKKIVVGGKITVSIELQNSDGTVIFKPNQSLLTSMHISILFAISKLASELRLEKFPMIFDAPTSSFGETKTTQFLNLIHEVGDQKILLTKNFLEMNDKHVLSIKKDFAKVKRDKAFWIYLERPFDKHNAKTLNTLVLEL